MCAYTGSLGLPFTGYMFTVSRLSASTSGMQTDEDLCIFLVLRACSFTAQALGNEQHRPLTTVNRRKNFKSLDMKCSQNSLVLLLGEIVAEKWSEMFGFGNFR